MTLLKEKPEAASGSVGGRAAPVNTHTVRVLHVTMSWTLAIGGALLLVATVNAGRSSY